MPERGVWLQAHAPVDAAFGSCSWSAAENDNGKVVEEQATNAAVHARYS